MVYGSSEDQHAAIRGDGGKMLLDVLVHLPALAKTNGLSFGVYTHEWDCVAWPKATKGFFAFRKSIPDVLTLDLPQTR